MLHKFIRLLAKFVPVRKLEGESERRTRVYPSVHEDSSTESMHKFSTGVAFYKKSIFTLSIIFPLFAFANTPITLHNLHDLENWSAGHYAKGQAVDFDLSDISNKNAVSNALATANANKVSAANITFDLTNTSKQNLDIADLKQAATLVPIDGYVALKGEIQLIGKLSDIEHINRSLAIENIPDRSYRKFGEYAKSLIVNQLNVDQESYLIHGLTRRSIWLDQDLAVNGYGTYDLAKEIKYYTLTFRDLKLTLPVDNNTTKKEVRIAASTVENTEHRYSLTLLPLDEKHLTQAKLASLNKTIMHSWQNSAQWNARAYGIRRLHFGDHGLPSIWEYNIQARNEVLQQISWSKAALKVVKNSVTYSNVPASENEILGKLIPTI